MPDIKLNKLFSFDDKELKDKLNSEQFKMAQDFKDLAEGDSYNLEPFNKLLYWKVLRNIGVHACGVIITPDDITKFVPVGKAKGADLLVTQFEIVL